VTNARGLGGVLPKIRSDRLVTMCSLGDGCVLKGQLEELGDICGICELTNKASTIDDDLEPSLSEPSMIGCRADSVAVVVTEVVCCCRNFGA
jgi:hypothetical protein